MVLPASGNLLFSAIQTEFGGATDKKNIKLGNYYADGSYVLSGTSGDYGPIPSILTDPKPPINIKLFYNASASVGALMRLSSLPYLNTEPRRILDGKAPRGVTDSDLKVIYGYGAGTTSTSKYIMKTTSSGFKVWTKSYAINSSASGYETCITGIAVRNSDKSTFYVGNFEPPDRTTAGDPTRGSFVFSLNSDGAVRWKKKFPSRTYVSSKIQLQSVYYNESLSRLFIVGGYSIVSAHTLNGPSIIELNPDTGAFIGAYRFNNSSGGSLPQTFNNIDMVGNRVYAIGNYFGGIILVCFDISTSTVNWGTYIKSTDSLTTKNALSSKVVNDLNFCCATTTNNVYVGVITQDTGGIDFQLLQKFDSTGIRTNSWQFYVQGDPTTTTPELDISGLSAILTNVCINKGATNTNYYYVVGGYRTGFSNKFTGFIIKYDSSDNVVWKRSIYAADLTDTVVRSVWLDPTEKYVYVMYTYGTNGAKQGIAILPADGSGTGRYINAVDSSYVMYDDSCQVTRKNIALTGTTNGVLYLDRTSNITPSNPTNGTSTFDMKDATITDGNSPDFYIQPGLLYTLEKPLIILDTKTTPGGTKAFLQYFPQYPDNQKTYYEYGGYGVTPNTALSFLTPISGVADSGKIFELIHTAGKYAGSGGISEGSTELQIVGQYPNQGWTSMIINDNYYFDRKEATYTQAIVTTNWTWYNRPEASALKNATTIKFI
jgi:hypothetical protein